MSRLRWPDSTNSVSEKPGTIQFPIQPFLVDQNGHLQDKDDRQERRQDEHSKDAHADLGIGDYSRPRGHRRTAGQPSTDSPSVNQWNVFTVSRRHNLESSPMANKFTTALNSRQPVPAASTSASRARPPHFDAAAPSCGAREPPRSSVAGGSDRSPVSGPRTGDTGRIVELGEVVARWHRAAGQFEGKIADWNKSVLFTLYRLFSRDASKASRTSTRVTLPVWGRLQTVNHRSALDHQRRYAHLGVPDRSPQWS